MSDESDSRPSGPDGRHETEAERADRNYGELLQELRVAQTGVQILLGFLLTWPFAARFESVSPGQRATYLVTLVLSGIAMACLVAPVSQHRILFGQRLKHRLVESGDRVTRVGLACLWLSVVGALLVVTEEVANRTAAVAIAAPIAVVFVLLWYVNPLVQRARGPAQERAQEQAQEQARERAWEQGRPAPPRR